MTKSVQQKLDLYFTGNIQFDRIGYSKAKREFQVHTWLAAKIDEVRTYAKRNGASPVETRAFIERWKRALGIHVIDFKSPALPVQADVVDVPVLGVIQ